MTTSAEQPTGPSTLSYTLLLTTHRRAAEAARVVGELQRTCGPYAGRGLEILVVGHELADFPAPWRGLLRVRCLLCLARGAAQGIWAGVQAARGEWFIWLCDDHTYPDGEWFGKLLEERRRYPAARVIAFESGTGHHECAAIGAADAAWFRARYPAPVYDHYGWDNEIQEVAQAEGVFRAAYHILIQDRPGPIQEAFKGRDYQRWVERRAERLKAKG